MNTTNGKNKGTGRFRTRPQINIDFSFTIGQFFVKIYLTKKQRRFQ